ncbi:uncharacterized protein LOC144710940 [Wolffia australiana]
MASTSAISMAMPTAAAAKRRLAGGAAARFQPRTVSAARSQIRASAAKQEAMATGLTAAAIAAALIVPEMAEAAAPGVSPSLKNFLLSIASGGLVLGVILGAVIAVSNFDPVKRA